jgi:7-cyano-7-deazaguanine synthase
VTGGTEKALVVLSGGQDSTTCLYWAVDRFGRDNVSSITFDYGQKHRIELDCARDVAAAAGVIWLATNRCQISA